MATVFLAQDRKHGRPVALKVLHAELAASLGPERFRREIAFAAQLQHPHVLTVLDSGEIPGGLFWFTMPFVEGESLRSRLRRERQLPVDEVVRIVREVAQALDYAHRHGVIHRDVKPENILLTGDGQAMVADFGIARALNATTDEMSITGTGMAVGTPGYMSPEQASGDRHLDARSDVYALGAVCYEMLVGEPPFTGPTPQAILAKTLSGELPTVRRARPGAPAGIDAAVRKALDPVPADRFATAADFARALDRAERAANASGETKITGAHAVRPVSTETPAARPASLPSAPKRRLPLGFALLGIGFLVGVGALFAWRSHGASGTEGGAIRVAVLPFENLGDSSDAYFADGLTDAVRGKLTAVPGLAVIAVTSSSQYRHTSKSPQQIAQELGGVRYLLVGNVRWAKAGGASRVQVRPSLIDVTTGTDTWEQAFDAPFKDVFEVQGDIAGRVVQALGVALNAGVRQTLGERPTENVAAYDAYLKGEALGPQTSVRVADLQRASGYYQDAIALDSNFAPAWARLATTHATLYFLGSVSSNRAESARVAIERARTLAPNRPDTYLAAGSYDGFVSGDNAKALSEFNEGLKISPSNAALLTGAALVEQSLGRWDASLDHLRQAQLLDPRNVLTTRRLAVTYLWLRRYPEATRETERGLTIAPDNLILIETKAMVALAQGDVDGARAVTQNVPSSVPPADVVVQMGQFWDLYWVLSPAQQRLLVSLPPADFGADRAAWATVLAQTYGSLGEGRRSRAYADTASKAYEVVLQGTPQDAQSRAEYALMLAYAGRKVDAVREGERASNSVTIAEDGYSGPYYKHLLARIYAMVGEPDKAIDALQELLKVPYWLSPGVLRNDPAYASLHTNPRFKALVGIQ